MDILPLEIWADVFGNLTTAADIMACSKASPVWEGYLKHKHPWIPLAETMKLVLPFLNSHTQLLLRQICHPLTEVVDALLDQQEPRALQTRLINRDSFHARVWEDQANKTKFGFWNPSLWHSISIQRMENHGWDWRLRIFSCLVKRGQYVEKCELTLLTDEDQEPMRLLWETLTYLPNLKKLIIVCGNYGRNRRQKSMIASFLQIKENIRLPPLKNLEELVMISVYPSVANKILDRYRKQLKQYSIYG